MVHRYNSVMYQEILGRTLELGESLSGIAVHNKEGVCG